MNALPSKEMIKAEFEAQPSPRLVMGDMMTPTASPLLASDRSPVLDRQALFEHLAATYTRTIEEGAAARSEMISILGSGRIAPSCEGAANAAAPYAFPSYHGAVRHESASPAALHPHSFGDLAGRPPAAIGPQQQPIGTPFRRHSVPTAATSSLLALMTPAQVDALMARFDSSKYDVMTDDEMHTPAATAEMTGSAVTGDAQHGVAAMAVTAAAGGHYFPRTLDDLSESERLARRRMQNRESAHRRRVRNKTMRQELQEQNEELRHQNAILMQTVERLRARLSEFDPAAADALTELPRSRKRASFDGDSMP